MWGIRVQQLLQHNFESPGLCFVTCPFSLRIMCYSHSSSARSGEQIATDSMNKLEVWNILNVQSFWVLLLNFSIHDIDHFYSSTPPKPLRRPPFAPWLMLVRLQQWSPYRQIVAIKGLIHAPTPVLPATWTCGLQFQDFSAFEEATVLKSR